METMPRDNLLCSASLELFEYIKRENIKELIKHLVVNHRERLLSLGDMQTFREIVLRYDQTQGYTSNMDYFIEAEDELNRKPPPNSRLMDQITVDPAEEDYWNTSDPEDEGEQPGRTGDKTPATNGSATPSKPLVDYPSDEEADDAADSEVDRQVKDEDSSSAVSDAGTASSVVGPPERLSEKRRREEDDEDELGKLMQNKRRNSTASASNSGASAGTIKRRKSFTAGAGNGTPKKIAISLSPALRTGAAARSDEEP